MDIVWESKEQAESCLDVNWDGYNSFNTFSTRRSRVYRITGEPVNCPVINGSCITWKCASWVKAQVYSNKRKNLLTMDEYRIRKGYCIHPFTAHPEKYNFPSLDERRSKAKEKTKEEICMMGKNLK